MLNNIKRLAAVAGVAAAPCLATVTTYTDYAQWSDAIMQIPGAYMLSEDFNNNRISTPGISLYSSYGYGTFRSAGNGGIKDGKWVDCVGVNGCNGRMYDSTILTLANGGLIYGIFADWKTSAPDPLDMYLPNASGQIMLAGAAYPWGGNDGFEGSFGFVSTIPFTQVMLTDDGGAQEFTMDNLVIGDPAAPVDASAAPEPAQTGLFGMGLLLLAAAAKLMRARWHRAKSVA